jgi:hypothetical protein
MAENNNEGCLFFGVIILRIGLPIYAGYKSWEIIDPESFFGFLTFLILWGILTTIIQFILIGIAAAFFNNN